MSEAAGLLQGSLRNLRRNKWLLVVLCAAFLLRLGFMLKFTPVISGDGCEYIRMGMEIRDGKPLTGVFEWPETMYGTFYPVLIAGVSRAGLSAEHAAKLLALLFGTGLVLMAFLLAKYVYGERVARYVAVLFAIFPVYVALSGSVFNETIYLTLWIAGIYWAVRALDSFRGRDFLFAGIFFGFSTLSRPEAFAYPMFIMVATGIVAVFRRAEWLKALRGVALLFGAWFVLMVPYAVFLHAHTGQYRFEGKWNINYTLGNRIDSGLGYFQAGLGLDDKLQLVGPLLDSSLYAAYTPYPHSIGDKLRYFGRVIHRNWPTAYAEVFSVDFGGPVTMLLVVLGLFGAEWSVRRVRHEFILAVMAISIVVLMLTAAHLEHRYSYPLPAIVLLWAGAGLESFQRWVKRTLSSWGEQGESLARVSGVAAVAGLCFAWIVFSIVGVRTDFYLMTQGEDYLGIKQAGLWLGAHDPGPKRIFGFEGRVAYYSGGTNIIFPYADSATTLKYLESKNIDYIVLDSMDVRSVPTLGQWFANGVPDSRAHLIYESSEGSSSDRIRVYSWDGSRLTSNRTSSAAEKE